MHMHSGIAIIPLNIGLLHAGHPGFKFTQSE